MRVRQWNHAATRDAIWHYAYGIGDDNPLWCDLEYGKQTKYGSTLAPPTFLDSCIMGQIAPKLRGIHWIYAGTEWHFFRPIYLNDEIFTKAKLVDAVWKYGGVVKRWIMQIGEVTYFNQKGELIARALRRMARVPRARAEGGMRYQKREAHQYSPEELAAIERDIDTEEVRGATPRYWEEVGVGDSLGHVVKGPLCITDMVCYYKGRGSPYLANEIAVRYRRRHPADAYIDRKTRAQGHPARGHAEPEMAQEAGMPGAYDLGSQRIAWVSHVLTNWMGDEGFLKKHGVSIRRPNIFGDTTWCKGVVTRKAVEDGEHLVECEVWAENQLGQRTAQGTSTIVLPSRD
ncbi:MAG: MaoC family dehydratase N-terminal domain-containing protein [Chloroflexi bacterium]|nr:MaoC family dehydratase N-terminal domain-containing protein [Chloroflexota bacterium]